MYEDVKTLLINELGVFPGDIAPEAELEGDLGITPIDLVSLLLVIEEEFEIQVDEEVLLSAQTVGDIVEYLEELF